MSISHVRATIDDLAQTPEKAELIGGRIVHLMATGRWPNIVAGRIYASLLAFAESTQLGEAYSDNMGFVVPELLSGRESFSPDASFIRKKTHSADGDMDFVEGPPLFSVEVRSKNDSRPGEEDKLAAKRVDYFEAGTKLVWDVDPLAKTIAVYSGPTEEPEKVFQTGDQASAEPVVPGWKIMVDAIFKK